jgi:hypothetical protein
MRSVQTADGQHERDGLIRFGEFAPRELLTLANTYADRRAAKRMRELAALLVVRAEEWREAA